MPPARPARSAWRRASGSRPEGPPPRPRPRERDRERRAATLALARDPHAAAVELDDVADDREAEAQSAVHARRRVVGLPEAFEDVRQELRFDALAGVRDGELDMRVDARE